jgi:hypothetical protein
MFFMVKLPLLELEGPSCRHIKNYIAILDIKFFLRGLHKFTIFGQPNLVCIWPRFLTHKKPGSVFGFSSVSKLDGQICCLLLKISRKMFVWCSLAKSVFWYFI